MPPAGGIEAQKYFKTVLNTDTELTGLILAGVRVEVVGRTFLESITAAQFGAHEDAHCGDGHSYRKPCNDAKGGEILLFPLRVFLLQGARFRRSTDMKSASYPLS